jgi:hypothetical protein
MGLFDRFRSRKEPDWPPFEVKIPTSAEVEASQNNRAQGGGGGAKRGPRAKHVPNNKGTGLR